MFFLVTQISQITQIFPSSIVYPQMRPIRSDYADFRCSIFLPFYLLKGPTDFTDLHRFSLRRIANHRNQRGKICEISDRTGLKSVCICEICETKNIVARMKNLRNLRNLRD